MAERDSKAVPPAGPCPGGDVEVLTESSQGEFDTVTGHSSSSESGESFTTPTSSQPPTPTGMEGCSPAVKAGSGANNSKATPPSSFRRRSRSQDPRPSSSKYKGKKSAIKSQDSIVSLTLPQVGSNASSTPRKRGRTSPDSNSDPQDTMAKKRHIASPPVASLDQSPPPPPAEASPPVPGPSQNLDLANKAIPTVISSGDAEGEEESSSAPQTPDNTVLPPPVVSQRPLVVDSGEESEFVDSDKHN